MEEQSYLQATALPMDLVDSESPVNISVPPDRLLIYLQQRRVYRLEQRTSALLSLRKYSRWTGRRELSVWMERSQLVERMACGLTGKLQCFGNRRDGETGNSLPASHLYIGALDLMQSIGTTWCLYIDF